MRRQRNSRLRTSPTCWRWPTPGFSTGVMATSTVNCGRLRGGCWRPRRRSRISRRSEIIAAATVLSGGQSVACPPPRARQEMVGTLRSAHPTESRAPLMPDANAPRIALLGVPIAIGASQLGTLMGPDALRTAGIGRILDQLGFAVEDHGNMAKPEIAPDEGPPPANAKYYDTIKNWIRALSERSYSLASSGAVPIFMGGDHSLSMGSVNGVARYWQEMDRPVFVLWLDAHADYNTPATTVTG